MEVEPGRLRGWRLASSVTPPSLALGLPFGIPGLLGDKRAGVTLEASCRARAAALAEGDRIGRPFGTLCLSLLGCSVALAFLVLASVLVLVGKG